MHYKPETYFQGLHSDHRIYSHLTCATESANIDYTFSMCCDVIFEKNFEEVSLE